ADYRLHARSKTCSADGRRVLEESIRVSRRYWRGAGGGGHARPPRSSPGHPPGRPPPPPRPLRGGPGGRGGRGAPAPGPRAAVAPDVLAHVVLLPALAARRPGWFERLPWLARLGRPETDPTRMLVWRDYEGLHPDGWAGPLCRLPLRVGPGERRLELEGYVDLGHHRRPLEIEFRVDDRPLGRYRVGHRRLFQAV